VREEDDVVGAEGVVLEVVLDGPKGVESQLVGRHAEPDLLVVHRGVACGLAVAPGLEDHLHADLHDVDRTVT
jgi:hypothetical protein